MRVPRPRLDRRRALAAGAIVAAAILAVVLLVADPFGGPSASQASSLDNGAPTSIATVRREEISSQQTVDGTLGYAESWTIDVPAGTAPSNVRQAQQGADSAQASLQTAELTLANDQRTLAQAQAKLSADRQAEASDCAGGNAAQSGSSAGGSGGGGAGASPCASAAQATATDQTAVSQSEPKVASDRLQVASGQTALAQAQQGLAAAQSSATAYESSAMYTMLPAAGAVIRRGQPLYAIGGQPTLLLYGPVSAWRAFQPGMAPGADVAQLNANLSALGYGALGGDAFTAATGQAVARLQQAHGLAATGVLPLGAIVFEPEAVRVTTVTPTTGQAVQPGPIMTASSTRHDVAIQLDAANQSQVEVGDRVVITLPDNSTTPGVVSDVGKVATVPSNNNGGPSSPTIEVDVRLLHEAAAGTLDQAPVSVSITTATVPNAYVVPVNALLALASGGYALETVGAGGVHTLIPVTVGPVFDDADGTVQVSGPQVQAGERVVVPSP